MRRSLSRRSILRRLSLLGASAAVGAARTVAAGAQSSARPLALDIRAFGAVGDGASDDTRAFRMLHRAMRQAQLADDAARAADRARPPIEFLVQLPPGHYRYTWNRWTWGVRRVTVFGYGAAIQCMHPGPYDIDSAPLISNREHYWTWNENGPAFGGSPPAKEDYGRLIHTARPGDMAVVLVLPRYAAGFSQGAWVLIQSYAQQMDGYPPNMRYFERMRVASVKDATVYLDRPLRFLHKEDWPEDPASPACIGRARIVLIDRRDCPFAIRQSFLGLTVRSNPNHRVRDPEVKVTREVLAISGTLEGIVRDCSLIAFGVTQAANVLVQDSSIVYTEPDKLIDQLTFQNCRIRSLSECTGVNRMILRNCEIETPAQIFSREAFVDGCSFAGPLGAGEYESGIAIDGPNPTRHMSVTGSRFFGRNDPTGLPFGGQVWADFKIDNHFIKPLDGYHLWIAAGSEQFGALVALLEQGMPVQITGRDGYRFGSCLEIRGEAKGVVLGFRISGPFKTGDVLRTPRLTRLVVRNCQFSNLRLSYPDAPLLTWEREVEDSRTLRLALRSNFASRPAWLPGYPRRIACLVTKPYSGPDQSCFLTLQEDQAGVEALNLSIDLKVAGHREITRAEMALKQGDRPDGLGKAENPLSAYRFIPAVSALIVPRPGAVPAPAAGSAADQANLQLEIEVDNPFSRLTR